MHFSRTYDVFDFYMFQDKLTKFINILPLNFKKPWTRETSVRCFYFYTCRNVELANSEYLKKLSTNVSKFTSSLLSETFLIQKEFVPQTKNITLKKMES